LSSLVLCALFGLFFFVVVGLLFVVFYFFILFYFIFFGSLVFRSVADLVQPKEEPLETLTSIQDNGHIGALPSFSSSLGPGLRSSGSLSGSSFSSGTSSLRPRLRLLLHLLFLFLFLFLF
jgi:hypothetical protein